MEENTNTHSEGQINPSNIISRVIGIITKPKQEWETVAKEKPNTSGLIMGYAIPLALIPAIATIIGWGVVGKTYSVGFFSGTIKSWPMGIQQGVIGFISSIAAIFITALIVDALAQSFKSEKNFGRSLQLTVYGFTPAWVGGIFNIIPSISWLGLLVALYGIYVMYLAFGPIKKTPEDKKAVYLLSTIGILIACYIVLGLIIGIIVAMFYTPSLGSFGL